MLEQITGTRKILVTTVDCKVEYKNLEVATKETQVRIFNLLFSLLNTRKFWLRFRSVDKASRYYLSFLATPEASEADSSGTSISIPLAFNFGRMLQTDEFARRKRTPQEPASLQALLANHRIDTNVLKTRAQLRQPAQLGTILTPNRDSRLVL